MLSPHTVTLSMLIHVYVSENDDSTWFRRKVKSVEDFSRKEANSFLLFLLDEISRNSTRSFSQLQQTLRDFHKDIPFRKIMNALNQALNQIRTVDDLVSFLEESDQLLVRPNLATGSTIRPDHVSKESSLGLYVRRFVLEFKKRSFWCISRLFEQVREYAKQTTKNGNDETSLSKMSRIQLQRYLKNKILNTEKRIGMHSSLSLFSSL